MFIIAEFNIIHKKVEGTKYQPYFRLSSNREKGECLKVFMVNS